MSLPFFLDPRTLAFPPPEAALEEPNGLLAIGGDLSPERLLLAYRKGIFPWYNEGEPILWWSPDPRAVLFPERLHIPRSLRKTLKKRPFEITFDTAFNEVIEACAAPRREGSGTWITETMKQAYARLHALGHAHSVECWREGELVGGLYGVAVGKVFCGESMFSRANDASKVALVNLVRSLERWGFRLIDCQLPSPHLERLGAECIPRRQFLALLEDFGRETPKASWHADDVLAS